MLKIAIAAVPRPLSSSYVSQQYPTESGQKFFFFGSQKSPGEVEVSDMPKTRWEVRFSFCLIRLGNSISEVVTIIHIVSQNIHYLEHVQ